MRRLNNSIFQGDPPKLDMSQFWNKPADYPFEEEEQPSPPANRTQLAIDRGYLPEREEGLSNQEYMDALAENPKEKKPFDFFNFGLGMRRASAGASWLSGIKERNRQNQYLQNQLSTLGQLDALPAEQPNPYNLYAKYGGKLSKFAKGGTLRKFQTGGEDPKKDIDPKALNYLLGQRFGDISTYYNTPNKTDIIKKDQIKIQTEKNKKDQIKKNLIRAGYDETAASAMARTGNLTESAKTSLKIVENENYMTRMHPNYNSNIPIEKQRPLAYDNSFTTRALRGRNILTTSGTGTGNFLTSMITAPGSSFVNMTMDANNRYNSGSYLSRAGNLTEDLVNVIPNIPIKGAQVLESGIQKFKNTLLASQRFNSQKEMMYKGLEKQFSPTPSSPTPIIEESVISNKWQMKNMPGLHLQSTMDNGAISKIVESKTGLVNIDQALAIIGKESSGADKIALVKQGLGENIPKKMDYNDFRKIVQDQIIPLEKQFATHSSDYGLDRLGYVKKEGRQVINNQWVDFPKDFPIENKTLILGNKNRFGRGSSEHRNPEETLGHIHFLRDVDSPNILTATQIQSDAFQGTHRLMPKDLIGLEKQKRSLWHMENLQENNRALLNKMETEGRNWDGDTVQDWEIKEFKDLMKQQENANNLIKNEIENFSQKQLLEKGHQERYLQELVDYASKREDVTINKIRIPTSETASKVQNYKPVTHESIGPKSKVLLDKSNSFEEFFKNALDDIGESADNVSAGDISSLKQVYNNYKSNTFDKPIYEVGHATILKRYKEYPKIIKKLYNTEAKLVSDRKGNEWYEFDIPENFKKGQGQIKAFKKGGIVGKLTPNKAREILHDNSAQGHPLTDKQRRFFGAKSKGHTNFRGRK